MINKYQVYRYFEYLILNDVKKHSFSELDEDCQIFKEMSIRKEYYPKKTELNTILWWENNNFKISTRLKFIKSNFIKTIFIEKYITLYILEKQKLLKELLEVFD